MELTEQLQVRLTADDLKDLRLKARFEGRPISGYVRELIKRDIKGQVFNVKSIIIQKD
jgi:hypothetical protein